MVSHLSERPMERTTPAIDTVLARMEKYRDKPALFWKGRNYTYLEFGELIHAWEQRLQEDGIGSGMTCAFLGDYSPQTCALIFALIKKKAILVPLTSEVSSEMDFYLEVSGTQILYRFDAEDGTSFEKRSSFNRPPLVTSFLEHCHPGLIVFTSGSTGEPKGILHDCENLMSKFVQERQGWKTVLFLLMDHFGGFNTFLGTFAYGGVGVCPNPRTSQGVAQAIQDAKANLLPTTPTFLNLIIASRLFATFDFSSVELITYGTELMSETTLKKVLEIFPNAKLKQTYGLSEQGVLHSKSESKDSTWVKIGGPGFETKVVDNILWLRSKANMVGYLNAPNPFDEDGWMCTGDEVEVKGEYLRFLGRKSEVINVGGKKMFPIETETILLQASNIQNVAVFAKSHSIMGQVVHAQVSVIEPEDPLQLSERLRKFCNERLAKYKVPLRFSVVNDDQQHNARFKKIRRDAEKPGGSQ
jgi:long-chain acyl-CoA synthetase